MFFPSGACRQKRNDDKLVNTFIVLDNAKLETGDSSTLSNSFQARCMEAIFFIINVPNFLTNILCGTDLRKQNIYVAKTNAAHT